MNNHLIKWSRACWQAIAIVVLSTIIAIVVNQIRPKGLILTGPPSARVGDSSESDNMAYVTIEEADALFTSEIALFVDARSDSAYEKGHIAGACSLPWSDFESRFEDVFGHISPDTMIICYCDGAACKLSQNLSMALLEKGYGNVRILKNGWGVWQDRSLPTEQGPGGPCKAIF